MKSARLLFLTAVATLTGVLAVAPARANPILDIAFIPETAVVDARGASTEATVVVSTPMDSDLDLVVDTELHGVDGELHYALVPGADCGSDGDTGITCRLAAEATLMFDVRFTSDAESGLGEGDRLDGGLDIRITATYTDKDYSFDREASLPIELTGTAAPPSVASVSGTVTDAGDAPVPGAEVTVTDASGAEFTGTSDHEGRFTIEPGDDEVIAPGELTVTATADGMATSTVTVTGVGGEATTVAFAMAPTTAQAPPEARDETPPWTYVLIGAGLLTVGALTGVSMTRRRSRRDRTPAHARSTAPVAVNPPTLAYGQIDGDEDLARYGSPRSGFGPAYGHGEEQTREMDIWEERPQR